MRVFADTWFYLALFNTRDTHHQRVVDFVGTFTGGVVTTQWVLTEVADAFASIPQRRELQAKFRVLAEDPGTQIAEASPELFERGLALYNARPEKEWSLTDCISFVVVMSDEGLAKALTGDRHFEQADSKRCSRKRCGSASLARSFSSLFATLRLRPCLSLAVSLSNDRTRTRACPPDPVFRKQKFSQISP